MTYDKDYLAARLVGKKSGTTLVFVHGLLGQSDDWEQVISYLALYFQCVSIDLPGHGQSVDSFVSNFDETVTLIQKTIAHFTDEPFWLVGYSLGARVCMYLSAYYYSDINKQIDHHRFLKGLIVESGHPGLAKELRQARLEHDEKWACRFEQEPIKQVLRDWYQQSVFLSLEDVKRQDLIIKRCANVGSKIAMMLRATSLAKQPYLVDKLSATNLPLYYLSGEEDLKFSSLAAHIGWKCKKINKAGHNIHAQYPEQFSQIIKKFILKNNK